MSTSPRTLIIYGSGGYGQELAWLADDINRYAGPAWDVAGYLDDDPGRRGATLYGRTVIGTLDDAAGLTGPGVSFVIGIGSPSARDSIAQRVRERTTWVGATLVHPSAVVGADVTLEPGVVIGAHCVVGPGARIGANAALNVASGVGHNALVGPSCVVSPGARVSGGCRLGARVFVGSNAVLAPGRSVGDDCVIGALAFVVKDVANGHTAFGNPARAYLPNVVVPK